MTTKESFTESSYLKWRVDQERKWEALCSRCGACCGAAEGDPCEHLQVDGSGRYCCAVYQNRFGWHQTVNGEPLRCVPIRDILHKSWPGDRCCGYKNRTE
ncbi:MAG: hypothetical protein KC900_04325 [Candidatus Omnitrophica bacterium]|nr:hypothetical protein [Candidatus Omnitrophota bacterium]